MASWDAKGRIQPVWNKLDGPDKRGQLAALSGVRATELSAHNQGKPLGPKVAAKIVEGAARAGILISNLDLGAPEAEADAQGQLLLDRLEELAVTVGDLLDRQVKAEKATAALRARVRKLEAPPEGGASASRRPRKVG